MKRVTNILGNASDVEFADRLHELRHKNLVEYLIIDQQDILRKRLRGTTDRGSDIAIALPRDQKLSNGAILTLDKTGTIVVRMSEERWLYLEPLDTASALELGYFVGNLHWRVRFDGETIGISLEVSMETYRERLKPFLDSGKASVINND